MPATSIRDLIVHGDDLVVGTHGRGFWILDDMTALRQIDSKTVDTVSLFKPQTAVRVRNNNNTDTPLPPDEPAAQNPPDGAVLDYYLPKDAHSEVMIEVLDSNGSLIKRYRSDDPIEEPREKDLQVPYYWVRPDRRLGKTAGFHRWVWDLHYTTLENNPAGLPMAAIEHDTVAPTDAPWVLPGTYLIRLSVDGSLLTQNLKVVMDPRTKASPAELGRQFAIAKACYDGAHWASEIREAAEKLPPATPGLTEFLGGNAPTGRRRRGPCRGRRPAPAR